MRHQPVPRVTSADVVRVVRRDFPDEQVAAALAILGEYGTQTFEREPDRVRLAILKLAAGDIGRLRQNTIIARCDYRDVLAAAEYPNCMKHFPPNDGTGAAERDRMIDADWRQYREWFGR